MMFGAFCLMLSFIATFAADMSNFSYYQNRGSYATEKFTISAGFENLSMMWYPVKPDAIVHCYVFCLGTGAIPQDYSATAEHIASHGFVAIYVPMRPWEVTNGFNYCRDGKIASDIPELKEWMDSSRIGAGGHSGGGPYAVKASSGEEDVKLVVAQHAASIPLLNKQSNETMEGDVMVLCGTEDHMPFCDCPRVKEDYYDRAPHGRVIAQVPDGHVSGACFADGETFESGYVTAMLYYSLREVGDAAVALQHGNEGDSITVDLS